MMEMEDDAGLIFRQEATELVAAIEAGLLDLERAPGNSDLINAVFRDLHTVKGSGAMFGHTDLARFVHDFESAFEMLRDGRVAVTPEIIAVSLKACDQILSYFVDVAKATEASAPLLAELKAALAGEQIAGAAQPSSKGWHVQFRLAEDAVRLGHNPALILKEISSLGNAQIRAQTDAVPKLSELDPTSCVIAWKVEIEGDFDRSRIDDVFLFLADSLDLQVQPFGAPIGETAAPDEAASNKDTSQPEVAQANQAQAGETMRIATERLDELMDRVGELVIAEARLHALAQKLRDPSLLSVAEDIQRLAAGLRDSTMSMRMVPIGSITGRFRRLMRDLSGKLGKSILFETRGEDTELDKTVIEMLADPLVHILRNAADHALETTEERIAAGKPAAGKVVLSASYSGAEVLIEVRDDGRGLDASRIRAQAIERGLIAANATIPEGDLYRLIFQPGFSTSATITELSGRGVGMDVVRRTIDELRGQIELTTEPGHGTTVTLRLPLTLAIIDGLLIEVGEEQYSIPLAAVEECVELPVEMAQSGSGSSFLNIRGALVPFLRLRGLFKSETAAAAEFPKVVVVSASGARVGLVVDRIVANNQTVIKQLSRLHADVKGFSGATILSDGRVALILDVPQLVDVGKRIEDSLRQEWAA
jgi:two-component system, chemotaxis family, sensor kinase CheA